MELEQENRDVIKSIHIGLVARNVLISVAHEVSFITFMCMKRKKELSVNKLESQSILTPANNTFALKLGRRSTCGF